MKCQNCGKNEINFHYSSNVNGCVTETNLCSQCAEGAGYDMNELFDTRSIYNEFFPVFGGGSLLAAAMSAMPMMTSRAFPRIVRLGAGTPEMCAPQKNASCGCGECGSPTVGSPDAKVDDTMAKRRELNMQMRKAAENEDFEKAAELRDQIKELGD